MSKTTSFFWWHHRKLKLFRHSKRNHTGYCRRFRLVSFRDNDVWVDGNALSKAISSDQKSFTVLLSQSNIPNHVRQAALAARKLGEGVFDGTDAVTSGLAKRGVVQTYIMIEGCAKELGCTAIVRVRRSCDEICSLLTCAFHIICLLSLLLFA